MTTLVGAGVAVLPATAQAETVQATLIKTTWTGGPKSTWAHPSPDPSGITYNSRTGRLIISDGEVDETGSAYPKNVWMGTNLYVASLEGELLETGANTMAYSSEPVGVGFRPTLSADFPERLFVSDDNLDRVFEVDRGADDRYGTADDKQTSFSTRFTGSSFDDPEDVAVDLEVDHDGRLLIIDGYRQEVYVYGPGPNKKFDGLPADGGDDTLSQFDVAVQGARTPEGIAYNASRNTIFVLDDPSNQILEFNLQGKRLNIIKLPFRMNSGAGIALAPPSNGSGGAPNAYIVDRGVDNDTNQDTFNDGRLYEVAIPPLSDGDGGSKNTAPEVSAGPDQSIVLPAAASLNGSVRDDGLPNGTLTTQWSRVSGPGEVVFGDATKQDTTASFPSAGRFVLRLTAGDGEFSAFDDVVVTVSPAPTGSARYSHNFTADEAPDVIAARSDGALILYSGNGRGGFGGSYPQIGAGWQTRDMIRHAQDFDRNGTRDVIARDPSNGNLWLYTGNGSGGFSGQYVNGSGWNVFSEIVAPGDFSGDGNPDLITVRPDGTMNLYPGNGAGGFGSAYPQIGAGWQYRDQIVSVGDWDGDGRNDLVAREPGNGNLWLYSGNGAGGFASQRVIGWGWGVFTAIVGPGDFDGNGTNDFLARRANGDLYLYPGNGSGGFLSSYPQIGAGWAPLRIAGAGQQ